MQRLIYQSEIMTLAEMPIGGSCVIVKVHGHGGFRHRIQELGFVRGEEVHILKQAPLADPIEYEVMGSHVALRRAESRQIEVLDLAVEAHPDYEEPKADSHPMTFEEHVKAEAEALGKQITVALVGNPNCGKTSFFNFAAGMREKVGNYSGVTVDSKIGTFEHRGYTINLVDLPGTYSLTEYSPDEMYVRDYLDNSPVDVVLNIVNAGNLERNLFLTTQLIDRNHPMVMALNMYDELEKSGDKLNYHSLSTLLGFPVVPVIARTGWGIDDVLEALVQIYEGKSTVSKHIHINYGKEMEQAINEIKTLLAKNAETSVFHSRYVALKLIENDITTTNQVSTLPNGQEIIEVAKRWREQFEKEYNEEISTIISDIKFGFIRGALSETLTRNEEKEKFEIGYALDKILTNKWLGFPILILFLIIVFELTFKIGGYLQDWIDLGVSALSDWCRGVMSPGILTDLLVDGVIAGCGSVLVFMPQILILFFFIALLEDSGYMARAAFIMDKLMHRMGLHGKSFIPYFIGFGCSVPGILAARTLENPKDRILTIITVPFISCSARLPVYMLLVAAFFPKHQAMVLLLLYIIGLLFAIITSLIINKISFKQESNPFVMELPPYRFPTFRNGVIHMWDKASEWFKRVSTIVLLASIIIWALGYFPHQEGLSKSEQMEQSLLGKLGHAIEPAFRPFGQDWRTGVSLIAGAAAKEVIISSMAVTYGIDDEDIIEEQEPLVEHIRCMTDSSGKPLMTEVSAMALLLFILIYFPCISTLGTIRQEIGSKWMWFSMLYNTGLAWIVATLFYQIFS